jgi:hypothetical protein
VNAGLFHSNKIRSRRPDNVQGRQDGVAHGAVGPLHIRTSAAQPEQSADGQDIEQQNCKDNIVEQIAVLSAEREQNGPDALDGERENGGVCGADSSVPARRKNKLSRAMV